MFTFTTSTEQTVASNLFKRTETRFYTETFFGDNDAYYTASDGGYSETSNSTDSSGNTYLYNSGSRYEYNSSDLGEDVEYDSRSGEYIEEKESSETRLTNGNISKYVSSYQTINSGGSTYNVGTATETYVGTTIIEASGEEKEEEITATTGTTTSATFTQIATSTVTNVATTEGFINSLGSPSIRQTITQVTTSSILNGTMQTIVLGTEEQTKQIYVITERTTLIENGQWEQNGEILGETNVNTVYEEIYTNHPTVATATVIEPRNNIFWSVTTTSENLCHISNIAESFTQRTTVCPTYITQQLETVYTSDNISPEYGISQIDVQRIKENGFQFSDTVSSTYADLRKSGTGFPIYSLPATPKTSRITTGTTVNTVENVVGAITAITAYTTSKNFGFSTFTKYPKLFSSTTIDGWIASPTTVSTVFDALEVLTSEFNENDTITDKIMFELFIEGSGSYSYNNLTTEEKEAESLHEIVFRDSIISVGYGTGFGWFPEIADKTYFENFGAPNSNNYGTNLSIQGRTFGFNDSTLAISFAEAARGIRPTSFSSGNTTYGFGANVSITEGTDSTIVPWAVVGNEQTRIFTRGSREVFSYIGQNQEIKNVNSAPNVKFMAAYTQSPISSQKPTIFRYPTFYATSNNETSGTVSYESGSTYTNSNFVVYNTFEPAFADIVNDGEFGGGFGLVTKSYAGNYYRIVPESFIP
jgi:hypothetical protein